MQELSEHPTATIPETAGSASGAQGIYRFFSNETVQAKSILASHSDGVLARARQCETVLAIQDTTDFNFSSHPETEGLGFINQTQQQGFKVHHCFAVSGTGEPLGLLHQQCWTREQAKGKREQRRRKPIEQKESYRWLESAQRAEQLLAATVRVVHVGDREADIFELFARPRQRQSELLIRVSHNRKVLHEVGYLIPTLEQAPLLGQMTVELNRHPNRPARKAKLQMRAMSVTLEVPRNHLNRSQHKPVTLNGILVEELQPTEDGGAPIRWFLLTTLPIDSFEQLCCCVRWYSYRWPIERFHFTLKSGCRIEQLQLRSYERLVKALATYSIVAWRLMWLTYRARLTPDESCELVLLPTEWQLLRRKFVPKSRSKKPPTLRQAMAWIAQLGGFLARKGDGEPGLKTIWRGVKTLHNVLEGAQLASGS